MLRKNLSRYLQELRGKGAGSMDFEFQRTDARWTGVAVRVVTETPTIGQPFVEPMS